MTPAEALRHAHAQDLADTVEIIDRWLRQQADRAHYRTDRIISAAARTLCTARGHTHPGPRGCTLCRADITATA